jgi:subtilase family serine protease
MGVDGVQTTFFGVNVSSSADAAFYFFGTSAAAPTAAGVAAIMLQVRVVLQCA